ncbi:hypothetical protein GGI05_003736, partial [Coemansia sp. RSA 2603]
AALALAADAQAAERRVDGVLALVRAEEFRPAAALQDVRRVAMHAESLAAEALAACGHVPRVAAVRAQVLADHVARACDVALAASLGALAEQSLRAAKAASVRVARRLQGVGAVDASVVDGVAAAAEAAAKLCELALRGQGDAEDGDDAMDGAGAEHVRQAADAATAALDAAIAALDAAGDSASAEPAESPAPWERRAQAFKASLVSSADAERQLSAQREQVVSLARELKLRDQRVQDSAVRAAMLEKRVDELRRQARDAQDVQQALVQAQSRAAAYDEALGTLQAEFDKLDEECRALRQRAPRAAEEQQAAAVPADLLGLRCKVAALMDALAAVRRENSRLRRVNEFAPAVHVLARPLLPALASAPPASEEREMAVRDARAAAREALRLAAAPRLVRLHTPADAWSPLSSRPQFELYCRQTLAHSLQTRVDRVQQRLRALAASRLAYV